MIKRFVLAFTALALLTASNEMRISHARPLKVAVLDVSEAPTNKRATAYLLDRLKTKADFQIVDPAQSRAAARGIGYRGSLNMTLSEARDLGTAIGCDFYLLTDAQTLRRSPSAGPPYYEAYASLFIVSTRTGKLIMWERPSTEAPMPTQAEERLVVELGLSVARIAAAILQAVQAERAHLMQAPSGQASTPDGTSPELEDVVASNNKSYRAPYPYRRLRPIYPAAAARAEAEATVEVLVEIDEEGRVGEVEVVRWAGFGLDEAVISTVKQMSFRPAQVDAVPISVRVLLRYNFRRPSRSHESTSNS